MPLFPACEKRLNLVGNDMAPVYWTGYRHAVRAGLAILTIPDLRRELLGQQKADRRRIHLGQAQLLTLAHETDKQWHSVLVNATKAIEDGLTQFRSTAAKTVLKILSECCEILNCGELDLWRSGDKFQNVLELSIVLLGRELAQDVWSAEASAVESYSELQSESLWYLHSKTIESEICESLKQLSADEDKLLKDLVALVVTAARPKSTPSSRATSLYRNSFSRLGTHISGGIDSIIEGNVAAIGSVRILLLGPGGSGKTTLYSLLNGLPRPKFNKPTKGVSYNEHRPLNFRDLGPEDNSAKSHLSLSATL